MAATTAPSSPQDTCSQQSLVWPRLRRWAMPALGVLVLGLLLSHAHKVPWAEAFSSLRSYSPALLAAAAALALASHALYGVFDLLGRAYTGHGLGRWRSWATAVASYAFNLNLGSLVGGVGLRARLYARAGLDETTIAKLIGLSLATNWLGYALLAGSLYAAGLIAPPEQAHVSPATFRALGGAMVVLAVLYVLACARWQGRQWRILRRCVSLPSPGLAALQLLVSAANWALMGAVMYLLLGREVPYGTTLGVLMAASIAGVVTPIPAGLGVLEAVYLALLGGMVGEGRLMGAVLAYRTVYYLIPLVGGVALYALLERSAPAATQTRVNA